MTSTVVGKQMFFCSYRMLFVLFVVCVLLFGSLFPLEAAKKKSVSSTASTSRKKSASNAQPQTNSPPERSYEELWRRFEIGNVKERRKVISELKAKAKQNPADGTCRYYLGMMLAQTGSSKAAVDHLRAAAAAFPDSPDVLHQLAEQLLLRNKVDEAVSLYEKILTLQPNHGGALTRLGLKALDDEQYQKALELLTKAHEIQPDNRETTRGLASALYYNGRYIDAEPYFKTVLEMDEKDAEAWYLLAKCYENSGKVKEASEAFAKAKQLGRRDEDIKSLIGYDLARALYAMGDREKAVAEYKKTIKTSSDPATGWFELARIYDDSHDIETAIDAYRKAFEADDRRGDAVLRIAELLREDGRLDEALGALDLILRKKDWSEQAKAMIEEISDEKREDTQEALSETVRTGSEDEREQAYLELLAINKKDREALEGLKELAINHGDFDKAKYYVRELKKAGYLTQQEADSQINEFDDKMDAGDDLTIWESRLEEYKKNGEWDKAIEMNKKIYDYTKDQLEDWKKVSASTAEAKANKKKMIEITQVRLRLLRDTMKELREAKKQGK